MRFWHTPKTNLALILNEQEKNEENYSRKRVSHSDWYVA